MRAPLYIVQGLSLGKVNIMARPRGRDWLFDEVKALRASSVDILVSLLTSAEVREFDLAEEAAFCHQQGIMYLSLPIHRSQCASVLGVFSLVILSTIR
jgi:hypothetical protein